MGQYCSKNDIDEEETMCAAENQQVTFVNFEKTFLHYFTTLSVMRTLYIYFLKPKMSHLEQSETSKQAEQFIRFLTVPSNLLCHVSEA